MGKNGTVFTLKENNITSDLLDDIDGLVFLLPKFQSSVNDRRFFLHWHLLKELAGRKVKGGNYPRERRLSRPPLSTSPWTSTMYHIKGHEGNEFFLVTPCPIESKGKA